MLEDLNYITNYYSLKSFYLMAEHASYDTFGYSHTPTLKVPYLGVSSKGDIWTGIENHFYFRYPKDLLQALLHLLK